MIELGGDFARSGYQGEVDAYRDARMNAQATATAADAVKAIPDDTGLKLIYAGQLADAGKPDDGIALAKSLINGKNDRDVQIALAQIYLRLQRFPDAEAAINSADALSQKPEDKEFVTFLRGTIADKQKQYDAAEVQFRKVLANDPNNAQALNYLGYMFADRGVKLDEALVLIRKAVDAEPQNGAYLDSLGWVYFKLGQYALAEENLRKAVERLSTDPTVHDHLGELYEKTGKLKLAVAQWERSLNEAARSLPADVDPADTARVQKKLEGAKVKLAKEGPAAAAKP